MRYSKLTYCLLAFLCLATTSCIQNELIEEYPIEQENPVQVHLTLNMPQATSTDIQAGTAGEQYINDVHVYVFSQNGSFIEKYNALDDHFSLLELFADLNLCCDVICINWDEFKTIDVFRTIDLYNYFSDIWFPSADNIIVFPRNMTIFIMIRHDGVIYYVKCD